jgi:RNA polymerase sigma-70 factor (ECF subfamily)
MDEVAGLGAAGGLSPDAALVVRARDGDRPAFGHLYARFAPLVHGVLLARVPRTEVDDLVHDVFIRAMGRIGALRDPAAFGPWLAAIARNTARDHHRRRHDAEELPDDVADPAAPQAEAVAVLAAIRGLPHAYRETLVLRLVEGMTGPEIAERTGLTHGSVRVNLHRGMQLLRAALAGGGRP